MTKKGDGCYNESMYAIVFFPKLHSDQLDEFRKKYDPKCDLILPHITLVFPFPDSIDENALVNHVDKTLTGCKSFDIKINGYKKAHDNYLYLLLQRGDFEMMNLHDKLYTDILKPYLRADLEYEPHLTVGYFQTNEGKFDQEKYTSALVELEKNPFYFECLFDNLQIIKIDDQLTKRRIIKSFQIK